MSDAKKRKRYSEQQNAMYHTTGVIGNNAVVLEPEVEDYRQPLPQQKVRRRPKKQEQTYAKLDILCTFTLAFVIIATLGICIVFLNAQYQMNKINDEIYFVKAQIAEAKKDNERMRESIDTTIDLESVYQIATTELNMHVPQANEIVYIKNNPVTYTTKLQEIYVEDTKEYEIDDFIRYMMKVGE